MAILKLPEPLLVQQQRDEEGKHEVQGDKPYGNPGEAACVGIADVAHIGGAPAIERVARAERETHGSARDEAADVRGVVYREYLGETQADIEDDHYDDIPELGLAYPAEDLAVETEVDRQRADQSEDRARCAYAGYRRKSEARQAPAQGRQPVDSQEAPPPEECLQVIAQDVEGVAVEQDVVGWSVQERGGDEPPPFASHNVGIIFLTQCIEGITYLVREEDRDVDADQHHQGN